MNGPSVRDKLLRIATQRFAEVFLTRTRDEWTRIFADSDACVSPVLTPEEASTHPHATERQSFRRAFDVLHPSPVPRFSRSATGAAEPPPTAGQHSDELLRSFAFDADEIAALRACGALAQ